MNGQEIETGVMKIELTQAPVIHHKLMEVGKSVTDRINELNIDKMVANEDTVKSLKQLRSDLNKELKEYEDQRKWIKDAVAKPYKDFEDVYKTEVSVKFNDAIDKLKAKIDSVELKMKQETKSTVESYFNEVCVAEGIDFLKFENANIDINLSTSMKQYKDRCNEFVKKVSDDIALIKTTECEAEIMTEYKRTLNASKAITDVRERKEKEKAEADRIKFAETNRRTSKLRSLSMYYQDIVKTFVHPLDQSIQITQEDVENLSKEAFETKFVELEERAKATATPKPVETPSTPAAAPTVVKAQAEALKPPVVTTSNTVETPVLRKAKFEVTGTVEQLLALGEYMKSNGLTYINL